ncbi:MAG: VPLPA-CTERM sorting domain-containing protein [Paracoccaceae bacterium]
MQFFNKFTGSALALALAASLGAVSQAEATHGRGAAIVPSVDANGTLTVDMVGFWRQDPNDPVCSFPHDCITATVTGPGGTFAGSIGGNAAANSGGATLDLNDSRRAEVRQIDTLQLNQGAGLYTIEWGSGNWVPGVEGLANNNYGTTSTIFWDGSTANAPILFDLENIQQEVVRGQGYSDNLDATSGNGLGLTYASSTPGTRTGVAEGPDTFAIDALGNVTIDAGDEIAGTGTYDITDNISSTAPSADHAFEGSITNADGSSVEFYWVFDGVDTGGPTNTAPNLDDLVVNVILGQTLNQTIEATDPNTGDTLTLDLLSFTGSGETFPAGLSGSSPLSGLFSWDSTGSTVGDSFLAIFETRDDGGLTDRGSLRINVIADPGGTPAVPLPAGLVLFGTGLAGFGVLKARKKRS